MRRFFTLFGLCLVISLFTACTGFYAEKEEKGSITLDFSRAINAISSRTNFQEIDDAISPDDQYLNDLIKQYIKYKLFVQIKQVDGEYTDSTSVDIPFVKSSLLQDQIVEINNVPVGIKARVASKLTLEGFTEFMAALQEFYSTRISEMVEEQLAEMIQEAEEAGTPLSEESLAIIRERLENEIKLQFQDRIDLPELDNEITLAGESEEFVTIAGNNPVKVKLVVIDEGSETDPETDPDTDTDPAAEGVTIGTEVEYNKPLVLAYKNDESLEDSFSFCIKVATEGYEDIEWTIEYGVDDYNLDEPFTFNYTDYEFTITKENDMIFVTSESDGINPNVGLLAFKNALGDEINITCSGKINGVTSEAYFFLDNSI